MTGCPCCQSRKGRPVHVTESDDGTLLLIKAFCGCSTSNVLGAVGLQLSDLYDRPLQHVTKPVNSRVPACDVLELISHEVDCAALLLGRVSERHSITEQDWRRLAKAAARIGAARDHIRGR